MQCSTVARLSERTRTAGDPDAAGSEEQDRRGTCGACAPSRSAYLSEDVSKPLLLTTESAIAIHAEECRAGLGIPLQLRPNKGFHLAIAATFSGVRLQRF